MTKHRPGGSRAQHLRVIDVGPSRRHGVDQGEHLAPRTSATHAAREVDGGVDQAFETEADHQRGHEQQPGIGHQVGLVEGHLNVVDSARYCTL